MAGHPPRPKGTRLARGGRGERARRWRARLSPQGDQEVTDRDETAWFTTPWRYGGNVVCLLETLGVLAGGHSLPTALHDVLREPAKATAITYDQVERAGLEATLTIGPDGIVHPAAAAVLSNWIANSHGGGHVPNVHLRGVVGWLIWRGLDPSLVRWEIGRARAKDLQLDDGRSAEFRRLWRLREYAAAWRLSAGA